MRVFSGKMLAEVQVSDAVYAIAKRVGTEVRDDLARVMSHDSIEATLESGQE
jgi:hypothetical protein